MGVLVKSRQNTEQDKTRPGKSGWTGKSAFKTKKMRESETYKVAVMQGMDGWIDR